MWIHINININIHNISIYKYPYLIRQEPISKRELPVGHEGHGAVLGLPQRGVNGLDDGGFLGHRSVGWIGGWGIVWVTELYFLV
jgi:hypothetical protein